MSKQTSQNIDTVASFFSEHIYTPEIILTSWFGLSFSSMMLAMVFYGIAIHKNLAHHAFIEVITIGLISLSIYYTCIGYMQYDLKIKHATDACFANKVCLDANLKVIENNVKFVMTSSVITIVINVLIATVIVYNSYKQIKTSR